MGMTMNEATPWYVSLAVSFIPLLLLWTAFWWHGRQIRKALTAADGRSLAEIFAELAREMKRANDRQSPD
jgi:hypothetical protein